MKIILSRKGFDTSTGKAPSPILPDGKTLLSMPIPSDDIEQPTYCKLTYNGISYSEVLNQLAENSQKSQIVYRPEYDSFCHLDPDIRDGVRNIRSSAAFGQCGKAQKHLSEGQGVQVGDLFLFFGRFMPTSGSIEKGTLRFIRGAKDIHVVFGYMQIGEIISGYDNISKYRSHPHSSEYFRNSRQNTLYLASKNLSVVGLYHDKYSSGYGTFDYSIGRTLSSDNMSMSKWKLHDLMWEYRDDTKLPTLGCDGYKHKIFDDYFRSASRGQEFVFETTDDVLRWLNEYIFCD